MNISPNTAQTIPFDETRRLNKDSNYITSDIEALFQKSTPVGNIYTLKYLCALFLPLAFLFLLV